MDKKRLTLYGLIIIFIIGLSVGFYTYYEYLGEDPAPLSDRPANPIIAQKLRAVVTKKTVKKVGGAQKLVVDYTDLDNQQVASLIIQEYYAKTIQLGDTLTKDKGEKMVLVYQKNGHVETVPID